VLTEQQIREQSNAQKNMNSKFQRPKRNDSSRRRNASIHLRNRLPRQHDSANILSPRAPRRILPA
jgi:hypothetical protein